MMACVECTKLDACEELRMSRLVIEGDCGEQGNKALTSNKLSIQKLKYFSLGNFLLDMPNDFSKPEFCCLRSCF